MKRIIGLFLLSVVLLFTIVLSSPNKTYGVGAIDRNDFTNHNFNVNWDTATSNIISYSDYKLSYLGTNNNYIISFNSAQELYDFSVDVSYDKGSMSLSNKQHLMTKTYTLGRDIDYSVMQGSRFIPIGYSFTYPNTSNSPNLKFEGHFDGRGFEISNLYLAGHNDIIIDYDVPDSPDNVLLATSNYHAMFNYLEPNSTIKNVGLINPTIDVDTQNDDLKYFANLVGENKGIVENVFVIEKRTIYQGSMRIAATLTSDPLKQKSAAGIVHTNSLAGVLKNAYFAGEAVVNASYIYALKVEAVIFNGNGTNLVHDIDLYKNQVNSSGTIITIQPSLNSDENTTLELKNGTGTLAQNIWHYYASDRYPALWGLDYIANKYQISNAVDLITFTKLLSITTISNNAEYRLSSYEITNNINLKDVAIDAYIVPRVDFGGTLNGNNNQISNLTLAKGVNIGSGYYVGLFSVLSGTVKNIKLHNIQYNPVGFESYFGQHFYIGAVTGRLDNGLINNVYVSGNINLGNSKLGSFSIGGIAGQANGQVIKVYSEVSIDLGTHTYANNELLLNDFNLGGIIGKATHNKVLILYNAKNIGNLIGISTNNLESPDANNLAHFNIGGVIGTVNNNNISHNLGLLTNEGEITLGSIETGTIPTYVTNHVGGVIGYSTGGSYQFNKFQGLWENKGNIIFTNANQVTKAAGVIISNHSILMTYVQLFSGTHLVVDKNNVTAAALLYNIGNDININQAQTTGSYTYSLNNKDLSVGIYNENSSNKMNLRYVEIKTDINVDVTNTNEVSYAGVTILTEVNYYNVTYEGVFNVNDTNQENVPLWIAGISKELTSGYVMRNSLVSGSINVVANKLGNIYIGGLVNRNYSGNLHLKDGQARPKITIGGISNSINRANMTSTINSSNHGIKGLANTFAGGIATMNSGSIQDAVNLGDIKIAHLDEYVANRLNFSTESADGGKVDQFRSGVVLGGVTSIITNGNSRIFDTSNKGNIIGISEHFVRTGGILGVSLLIELQAGNITSQYSTATSGSEFISNSVLSNGINYGTVSAVGKTIGIYNTSTADSSQRLWINDGTSNVQRGSNVNMNSTSGTQDRLPIYASSGGVIGYGLSKMYRMLNHGNVYSTDVAGGIVGATFAAGGSETVVNINTAINYGRLRAIKNTSYNNINKITILHTYTEELLHATNSEFIIPTPVNGNVDIRRHPQSKRGIGGIFGRIQRGLSHVMTSVGGSFDFIVNMDENVDLIGRLDQVHNYSSSSRFFIFYDAIYYSAKENDTTQAVFTGFEYIKNREVIAGPGTIQVQYRYYSESQWWWQNYYKQLQYLLPSNMTFTSNNEIYHQIGRRSEFSQTMSGPANLPTGQWFDFGERENDPTNRGSGTTPEDPIVSTGTTSLGMENNVYEFYKVTDVPYISENSTTPNAEYVYDTNFIMRDDAVLVGGEPITSFIYYAENALLAPSFQASRPNGMYVLSTSAGSDFGSVLPRNLQINKFNSLTKDVPTNINYTNLSKNLSYDNNLWFEGVDSTLILGYESLYQTRLNDKSALLEENQVFEIQDKNDSGIKLQDPVIDGNTITFNIYRNLLNINNQELDFEITSALLPSNALIANTNATHAQLTSSTDSNIATGTLAPNLTINLANFSGNNVFLGTFVSFSEAAVEDIAFYNQLPDGLYQTLYTIRLNIIETGGLPTGPDVLIDGAGNWTLYNSNNTVTITDKLAVRFRDNLTNGIISDNYTMEQYIELYYVEGNIRTTVNSNYYTITNTLKDNNRYFSFEIDFSDELRPGNHYVIGYKFYPLDNEKEIKVNYNKTIVNEVTNLVANTGTYYQQTGTINGDIAFGDESLMGIVFTDFNVIIDPNIPGYLNNKTYEIPGIQYFDTSNFFDITAFDVSQVEEAGYYKYELNFILSSGANVTVTLKEKEIDPIYFKDTIRIPNGTTDITREALETSVAIDYEFIIDVESTFGLGDFNILIDNDTLNAFDQNEEKVIVTYQNGLLRFRFTDKLLPKMNGTNNQPYIIEVQLKRGTNPIIPAGILEITKLQGSSAYLSDIKFSTIISETSYANVSMADNNGLPDASPSYNPSIYYAGIDYDGSDLQLEQNYRIDGRVQKVPLDDFLPIMVEYLPKGASIQRKFNEGTSQNIIWNYTQAVTIETDAGYNNLFGDFTINQETLEPVGLNETAVITYKVTSEDSSLEVFYHITVTDVINNVTLTFDFKYQDPLNNRYNINDALSPLKDQLLTLNITNQEPALSSITYGQGLDKNSVINDVNDFPNFGLIEEINTVTNMFYVPNITGLSYRLARNQSGFYQFRVELPKGYDYEIYFKVGSNEQLLPLYSTQIPTGNNQGYYFYINYSESLRTSGFTVVVSDTATDDDWGLTDSN